MPTDKAKITKNRRRPTKTCPGDTRPGGAVSESMFLDWEAGLSKQEIAKLHGINNHTVGRIAKRDKWGTRKNRIAQRVQTKNNNRIVRKKITNSKIIEDVRDKVVDQFLNNSSQIPSATDVVRVLELCNSMGVGTEAGATDVAHGNPQALAKALEVIREFTDKALGLLGDWIVNNYKTPEELLNHGN